MKLTIAILLFMLTACAGQKPEDYKMTADEAKQVFQAQAQYIVAQTIYFGALEQVRKQHNWPQEVQFDARSGEWHKIVQPEQHKGPAVRQDRHGKK